ncbi:beta-defensin 13-like [Elgaria multicarinata webbii]|uniref:beta-defensin 13-like n=1 Tax=Elgaria multicarinata webbii TaxID=159646 RepID=UPI002FCD170A
MRLLYLLGFLLLFLYQAAPAMGVPHTTQQCLNRGGHCRRQCFNNERRVGTCNTAQVHCCR